MNIQRNRGYFKQTIDILQFDGQSRVIPKSVNQFQDERRKPGDRRLNSGVRKLEAGDRKAES